MTLGLFDDGSVGEIFIECGAPRFRFDSGILPGLQFVPSIWLATSKRASGLRACDSTPWGRRATLTYRTQQSILDYVSKYLRARRSPAFGLIQSRLGLTIGQRGILRSGLRCRVDGPTGPSTMILFPEPWRGVHSSAPHGAFIAATRTLPLISPRSHPVLTGGAAGSSGSHRIFRGRTNGPSRPADGVTLRLRPPATGPWCNGSTAVLVLLVRIRILAGQLPTGPLAFPTLLNYRPASTSHSPWPVRSRSAAVILAAGKGTRMGSDSPR